MAASSHQRVIDRRHRYMLHPKILPNFMSGTDLVYFTCETVRRLRSVSLFTCASRSVSTLTLYRLPVITAMISASLNRKVTRGPDGVPKRSSSTSSKVERSRVSLPTCELLAQDANDLFLRLTVVPRLFVSAVSTGSGVLLPSFFPY